LAGLRQALAERIKHVAELEHRAQVQRETALLLIQRIEMLSTKSWQEALEQQAALQADLKRLHDEFAALQADPHWHSVDPKYPTLVVETTQHFPLVWEAFAAALQQTQAAAVDASLPLPAVPGPQLCDLRAIARARGNGGDGAACAAGKESAFPQSRVDG
jgi:hypothetical protein